MLQPGTKSINKLYIQFCQNLPNFKINLAILVQISQMHKVFLQKTSGTENLLATTLRLTPEVETFLNPYIISPTRPKNVGQITPHQTAIEARLSLNSVFI